jgi:hypothetical protein
MFFLIRMTFWICVVLALLPSGGSKQTQPAAASSADIGPMQAVSAASATVADMSHFCSRQPEACAVGSQAAIAFGQRAQAGAKLVYDFITERLSARTTTPETGAAAKTGKAGTLGGSQNTLTPADLAPAWRGITKEPGRPA